MSHGPYQSWRTHTYKAQLAKLPGNVREAADYAYQHHFLDDPRHRLLQCKVFTHRNTGADVLRVKIGRSYRALAFIRPEVCERTGTRSTAYIWYWVGSHEAYNGVVKRDLI